MNTDWTGFYTCKECHKTESLWIHTTTDHKEGEQLEDRRNVGESSCNSGDGTDQRVQPLMFMMMMMTTLVAILQSSQNMARFLVRLVWLVLFEDINCVRWFSHFTEQNHSWETDTRSAAKEVLCLLWNPGVYYPVRKAPQMYPIHSTHIYALVSRLNHTLWGFRLHACYISSPCYASLFDHLQQNFLWYEYESVEICS